MQKTALILVGHGSHISPHTAGLVWQHVDALRAMGVADEVTAAFWKEAPSFHEVFNTLEATDITVVPLFTAQGYFTQTVIPAEMGIEGSVTIHDGRTIRYTRTLSEHPYFAQVIQQRIEDAMRQARLAPDETAVAIIGHGTRRNPESRKATEAQVETVRKSGKVADAVAVYLDDSPSIPDVYRMVNQPNLIAVPYFLALGSHATIDVPEDLGLGAGQTVGQVQGHTVYYTPPVGVDASLRQVIIELAREAGTPLRKAHSGLAWECFPAVGGVELIAAVQNAGCLEFGELLLTPSEVCPNHNEPDTQIVTFTDPDALRTHIREMPFRPLASAIGLPGDWRVTLEKPEMLLTVVETVYPGAVADWALHRRGSFRWHSLEAVAERQTGIYRKLPQLDTTQRKELIDHICGTCVRQPTWFDEHLSPAGTIPCGEPCNWWMTQALAQLPGSHDAN
ncbi:MAG: CbiX/SirB N-terminal domain-containing protein [Chloroflexota bacterium]